MNTGSEQPVGVAFASDRVEAEMIRGLLESAGIPSAVQQVGIDGPTVGVGLLNPGGGSRRILVRADQAEAARAVVAQVLVPVEADELDGPVDTDDVDEAPGRKPRDYNLIGAYARAWLWSLVAMGLAFAVFLLLRLV